MTGDAVGAPMLKRGLEGVARDAAALLAAALALVLAPNAKGVVAVVGVAVGGAPNTLVAGIDTVGLAAGAPKEKPLLAPFMPLVPFVVVFVPPNLKLFEAGAAG
ncbi:hypothetical protein RSAG8_03088, partial [Rhizoctonia solani AG-8 WAC10335]